MGNNPGLKLFLNNYTNRSTPDESTIRLSIDWAELIIRPYQMLEKKLARVAYL